MSKRETKQGSGGGRPSTYRKGTAWRYCELIEDGQSDTAAAALVGVPRRTFGRWEKAHADFAERLAEARKARVLALESTAFECVALMDDMSREAGFTSAQVQAGKNKFDMCLKLLQVYDPRFMAKQGIEHSGPGGKELELPQHTQAEMAEFAAMLASAQAEVARCTDGLDVNYAPGE